MTGLVSLAASARQHTVFLFKIGGSSGAGQLERDMVEGVPLADLTARLGGWDSTILSVAEEAAAHREAYASIMRSYLARLPRGAHGKIARASRIGHVYLSYLIAPASPRNARIPSPATASRLVSALTVDEAERQVLLTHMELSRASRIELRRLTKTMDATELESAGREVWRKYHAASYAGRPDSAAQRYSNILRAAPELLLHSIPERYPAGFLDVAFALSEVLRILDRPSHAVYIMGIAARIAAATHGSSDNKIASMSAAYMIEALRLQGATLKYLRLPDQALDRYDAAERCAHEHALPSWVWKPYIYADKLRALSISPHLTLGEAEGLARQAEKSIRDEVDQEAHMQRVLVEEALVRARVAYGVRNGSRRAIHSVGPFIPALLGALEPTSAWSQLGPIHRVMGMKSLARWHHASGDSEQALAVASIAWRLARAAGMSHHVAEVEEDWAVSSRELQGANKGGVTQLQPRLIPFPAASIVRNMATSR